MLQGKLLLVGVTLFALFIGGCSKKKDPSSTKFTQSPAASNQSAQTKTNESDDIFNEFYKDEKTGAQKEKLNSKETFTPAGASSSRGSTRNASGSGFSENGRYVVQVSTIRSEALAEKNKSKLENAGYPAYIAEVQNPTPDLGGTFYRLRIGGFSSISAAREFGENTLKPAGYDYWIDNKSNDNVGIDAGSLGNSGSSYSNSSYQAPEPTPSTSTSTSSSSGWGSSSSATSAPASSTSSTSTSTSSSSDWSTGSSSTAATSTTASTPAASSSSSVQPSSSTAVSSQPAATSSSQTSTTQQSQPATSTPAATPAQSTTPGTSTEKKDNSGWGTSGW